MSKVIAIVGATGAQGGGLARAILDDPQGGFAVRALTRQVDGDKARALAARGAEVVAADLDDEESLTQAFAGAYGAFCLTNFWEHFSPERELAQAKNMARAAKARGAAARDLVDARRHAQARAARRRPDADADGQVQGPPLRRQGRGGRLLPRRRRADHVPADVVLLGEHDRVRRGTAEGAGRSLCDHVPAAATRRCPRSPSEDIGRCAYGIFKRGSEFIGRTIGIAGEHLTGAQMAAALTTALGIDVAL